MVANGPVLVVGADTPQLAPRLSEVDWSDGCDAWVGPANDGGFWALGLRRPDPALVRGVPMSRPDTGAVQRRRLTDAGLRVRDLQLLRDVDTAADVPLVAEAAPGSRFAACAGRLAGSRLRPGGPAAASGGTP